MVAVDAPVTSSRRKSLRVRRPASSRANPGAIASKLPRGSRRRRSVSTLRPPFLTSIGEKFAWLRRFASHPHLSLNFPPPVPARRCTCSSATVRSSPWTSTRSWPSSDAARLRPSIRSSPPRRSAVCTTARRRASSTSSRSRPRRRSSSRSREYAQLAARLLATLRRQGGAEPGDPRVLAVDRDTARARPRSTARCRSSSRPTRASSTTRSTRARPRVRVLRPAHRLRPVPAASHPKTRLVIETPQQFFMRIACGLPHGVHEAHRALSSCSRRSSTCPARRRCSTPARSHEQLSSCFLLDSPADSPRGDLRPLQGRRAALEVLRRHRPRLPPRALAQGSLIERTNGHSNGIVPWLKTLDSSVAAVNQGGKRKGAALRVSRDRGTPTSRSSSSCATTPATTAQPHAQPEPRQLDPRPVHAARRGRRHWSLFDPKDVPELPDLYGDAFDAAYVQAEARGPGRKRP